MNPDQLELFPAAPGTKRSGGRGVSRRARRAAIVDKLVKQAQARGCTHVEFSGDGVQFVFADLLGRYPKAAYVPLDHPRLGAMLMLHHPDNLVLNRQN